MHTIGSYSFYLYKVFKFSKTTVHVCMYFGADRGQAACILLAAAVRVIILNKQHDWWLLKHSLVFATDT